MMIDQGNLVSFYQTSLGRAAQDVLAARVSDFWGDVPDERIICLGQGASLLGPHPVFVARMTGTQGEAFSCLVDSRSKPLPDASTDRVLSLHTNALDLGPLLREIWRVLRGEGRLLMIVPKRNSAWTRTDLPFGCEPAYTASQIRRIFNEQNFALSRIQRALYMPPFIIAHPWARQVEKIAPRLLMHWGGGVFLIEARKRVCAPLSLQAHQKRRPPKPILTWPLPISGRVHG